MEKALQQNLPLYLIIINVCYNLLNMLYLETY